MRYFHVLAFIRLNKCKLCEVNVEMSPLRLERIARARNANARNTLVTLYSTVNSQIFT